MSEKYVILLKTALALTLSPSLTITLPLTLTLDLLTLKKILLLLGKISYKLIQSTNNMIITRLTQDVLSWVLKSAKNSCNVKSKRLAS